MKALKERVHSFMVSEDGPTATEYAVMLALIIIVALAAITTLGDKVKTIFTNVSDNLPTGTGGAAS
jgi:pilus assembly protein Flp/PilA